MKVLVLLLLGAVAAQTTCTTPCGPNEKCLLPFGTNEYKCINLQKVGNGKYGALRKCITPLKAGCKGSNGKNINDSSECCAGIALNGRINKTDYGLRCIDATKCDKSEGCSANIQCPYYEDCINNKCVTPKPGVDCGECGQSPIQGKCCGSGVRGQDGKCFCGTSGSSCTNDSDCLGGSGGSDRICCGEKCCARSQCESGTCKS